MIDKKQFLSAITQIAEEKGLDRSKIIEAIETAMAAAYKKDYGKKTQFIKAKLNMETGEASFYQVKLVVDQSMLKEKESEEKDAEIFETESEKKFFFNPERHIMIDEAKAINSDIKLGDEIKFDLESQEDYGRIAAQTAKQIILQKLREVEKETAFEEFKNKEGELVSGLVQRIDNGNVIIDLGKTVGFLPVQEQIFKERYRIGGRIRAYVLSVTLSSRGPLILLSRSHPRFAFKIFEMEVPEISNKSVSIKSIAREAGSRTKIAVAAEVEGIDPIGSCVGLKGMRVNTIISELGGEKIDIIEWSENQAVFVKNALSPAKVINVEIKPYREALVLVPDDQLSLAIGKEGQNVRLAAKLTGFRIDVRSAQRPSETVEGGHAEAEITTESETVAKAKTDLEVQNTPTGE